MPDGFIEGEGQAKEQMFAQRTSELLSIRQGLIEGLSDVGAENLTDDKKADLFGCFSEEISEFFPEIALYQKEGQIASEYSPKPVDVEHRKTVASIYYLLLLSGDQQPIQGKDDIRFKALVPGFFQGKFTPEMLEEQRQVVNKFVGDDEKLHVMASMLAVHDAAKLESVAGVIEQIRKNSGDGHTSDHDVALQSLFASPEHVADLLPSFNSLPTTKQELIKSVLKAGSEINIGQIGQGLEGNPSQLEAISRVELSEDEVGLWFMENLCDTASAAGMSDGSALVMAQENVWNAWKWSVDSLIDVKNGKDYFESYLDLLGNKADELGVDFDRTNDSDITALRMCMALQTDDSSTFDSVRSYLSENQNMVDVFGKNGMTGEYTYRLYYAPSILRKITKVGGIDRALDYMNEVAGTCKEEVMSGQGEHTYQLSEIDAAIDAKIDPEELEVVLTKSLKVDDRGYVKFGE